MHTSTSKKAVSPHSPRRNPQAGTSVPKKPSGTFAKGSAEAKEANLTAQIWQRWKQDAKEDPTSGECDDEYQEAIAGTDWGTDSKLCAIRTCGTMLAEHRFNLAKEHCLEEQEVDVWDESLKEQTIQLWRSIVGDFESCGCRDMNQLRYFVDNGSKDYVNIWFNQHVENTRRVIQKPFRMNGNSTHKSAEELKSIVLDFVEKRRKVCMTDQGFAKPVERLSSEPSKRPESKDECVPQTGQPASLFVREAALEPTEPVLNGTAAKDIVNELPNSVSARPTERTPFDVGAEQLRTESDNNNNIQPSPWRKVFRGIARKLCT